MLPYQGNWPLSLRGGKADVSVLDGGLGDCGELHVCNRSHRGQRRLGSALLRRIQGGEALGILARAIAAATKGTACQKAVGQSGGRPMAA